MRKRGLAFQQQTIISFVGTGTKKVIVGWGGGGGRGKGWGGGGGRCGQDSGGLCQGRDDKGVSEELNFSGQSLRLGFWEFFLNSEPWKLQNTPDRIRNKLYFIRTCSLISILTFRRHQGCRRFQLMSLVITTTA